ncbi:MAG: hypothetical protein Q9227_009276 [Pyrenula ochraceoflavens]
MPREARDYIPHRGDKRPSPLGTTLFVLLRALDPLLQYTLLTTFSRPQTPSFSSLTPLHLTLLTLSLLSALKQILWILFLSYEYMPAAGALGVCLFNSLCNSLNTVAFTYTYTSTSTTIFHPTTLLGLALFTTGLTLELVSETQRRLFKSSLPPSTPSSSPPKLYTSGLFSLIRNPNYAGYALWRTGYAVVGGGLVLGAVVGGFVVWDFVTRAVPTLEMYCERVYGGGDGGEWGRYVERVRWRLIPGVY